jgi:hypothetical protein
VADLLVTGCHAHGSCETDEVGGGEAGRFVELFLLISFERVTL